MVPDDKNREMADQTTAVLVYMLPKVGERTYSIAFLSLSSIIKETACNPTGCNILGSCMITWLCRTWRYPLYSIIDAPTNSLLNSYDPP
jgi:hypothetical protein